MEYKYQACTPKFSYPRILHQVPEITRFYGKGLASEASPKIERARKYVGFSRVQLEGLASGAS